MLFSWKMLLRHIIFQVSFVIFNKMRFNKDTLSEQIFHFIVDVVNSICWCYSLGYCSQCYFYIGKVERVGQSLFAIDWHSFPGWSKRKLQNPPDTSLSIVRFVCAKPLDFLKLGLSSLATEHLTLRRSGGEGGGELGRTFSFAPRVVKRDPRNQAASAAACTKLFLLSVTCAKANKRRRSVVRETATHHFTFRPFSWPQNKTPGCDTFWYNWLWLIISWSKQYAFSRQSSFFTLLKHHSEGCHKLQFTGNHFSELMVKVSKTIMRNNTKGPFSRKSF